MRLLDDRSNTCAIDTVDTKTRILEAGWALILDKGFSAVGIKQILDSAGVPKGSFYYYFKSKEAFGVELIRHYLQISTAQKRDLLLSVERDPNPLSRLDAYLDGGIAVIEADFSRFPCLVAKLTAEVVDLSEAMRVELSKGLSEWIGLFSTLLDEAVGAGLLRADFDPEAEAQIIQDLLTGAVERAMVHRDAAPIRTAVAKIKSDIAGHRPGEQS